MITVDDVCGVIDGMRVAGCSEKTIGNALATLHSVLRFAARHGGSSMTRSPSSKQRTTASPASAPAGAGTGEVVRLLACTTDPYKPLVATALFTGMRISELLGLLWKDVDFRAGTIHI
jgi:integrase